tara:strand:+ start:299 stop:937 length:639 start_codon:yes stop_codon:yes gene_type:complete
MNFLPEVRERRYRVNRTSPGHFLNVPRGYPFDNGRNYNPRAQAYVHRGPGLQVFERIHSAIRDAERRLLLNPDEQPDYSHVPIPLNMDPMGINNIQEPRTTTNDGLLPRQGAPVEFTCGICMDKVTKGMQQQILTCGHKFCAKCFDSWHQQQGQRTTCPTCRTPVYNSSMNQQPRGRMLSQSPLTVSTRSLRGSQGLTPQQEALALFMRRLG